MDIISAQYLIDLDGNKCAIKVNTSETVDPDGTGNKAVVISVPLDPSNADYAEIMRQVEAGELVIQEADAQ